MRINAQRFFNFKKEFGWAELLATLALIFSLLAYFNDKKDDISLVTTTPLSMLYTEDSNDIFFIYCRSTIINNGNKPITLLGFSPHEKLGLSLVAKNGSQSLSKESIPYEVFQIPDSILTNDLFSNQENLKQFRNQGLEKLSLMNKTINPGEVYLLNIGIKYYFSEHRKMQYTSLFFSGQLNFSNGKTLLFGAGGNINYQHSKKLIGK